MPQEQRVEQNGSASTPYRLDVELNELLNPPPKTLKLVELTNEAESLPEPVYPQRPQGNCDGSDVAYHRLNTVRAFKTWAAPYVKSRWYRNELRPIVPYLFTEFKCNLDCHYCWSFNNQVKGMTEATAKHSIDWLHSLGSRVLALMGGEPLLRPKFIHKVVYYASKKGFFVYLPTNGRLMKPDVVDRLGDAGLATVNLAIDSVKERPQLPKSLDKIQPYFEYLLKQQRKYGYSVVLNINITRINIEDVKLLTEIGRDNDLITDYHINEAPMIEQNHFQHLDENDTYIRPEDYSKVDDLLDYLMEKSKAGYKIVNPRFHMAQMKDLMRGQVKHWNCRAGQNSLIIRPDGTLAPCFPMYSATYDWGTVGNHKFEKKQLDEMKKSCTKHCLSTCNYILGYCYDNMRAVQWIGKQAMRGFRGVTGSFD